jgi:hypothetical protein
MSEEVTHIQISSTGTVSVGLMRQSNEERLRQYHICKERGHKDNGMWLGEWTKCRYCETELRYETVVHEKYAPTKENV